jgi:superfamily I DNA/RNA helicase
VTTVGKFAHQLGFRIDFEGGGAASRELTKARARGIPRVLDAVLVDEVQDMDPAWLHFLLDVVRPGRGGVVVAGDPAQSLYRESDLNDVLRGRSVIHHTLVRPYRSTKPILKVASALSPSSPVVGIEWSPDGEPVDLIWASSWSEQAACVAWEIGTMVADGHRKPGDIAVLVAQRRGTLGRLRAALDAEALPYEVIDHTNVAQFDPAAPTVKLLTVHSGKGHEFPVVVLLGLEALPTGEDAEARQRQRVGFVGTTRAKDQLLISYTRQNAYLERLIALGDDIRRWTWPDDYEV